jgi:putative endonuclease
MGRNQHVGNWGEEAASTYLQANGYEIIDRNVRTPYGEIDLVARTEGFTVFVEVKARSSGSIGPPEIAVTPRKQKHMLASAAHYAQSHSLDHWQIDVVAVQRTGSQTEIKHFENAVAQPGES